MRKISSRRGGCILMLRLSSFLCITCHIFVLLTLLRDQSIDRVERLQTLRMGEGLDSAIMAARVATCSQGGTSPLHNLRPRGGSNELLRLCNGDCNQLILYTIGNILSRSHLRSSHGSSARAGTCCKPAVCVCVGGSASEGVRHKSIKSMSHNPAHA